MENRIVNKLNMYKAEIAVCTKHQSAWSAMFAFQEGFDELKDLTELLEQLSFEHAQGIVGVTAVKNEERLATAEKAGLLANSLRALATKTKNTALAEQMHFRQATLESGKATRAIQLITQVVNSAGIYAAELLTYYDVGQQQIDELAQLRDHLALSLGNTRNAIIERKALTAKIKSLVKEIDDLLKNNLDKQVKILKQSQPAFFAHYMAGRNVVDLKGKSNKPGQAPTLPKSGGLLDLPR